VPSVFLSHNNADKEFVHKLAVDLTNRGCQVWLDDWEIKAGDSIVEKIEQGIADNEYLIVILSRNSVKSRWVRIEINAAFFRQVSERKIKLVPVLIEDCEIPPLLCERKYADFRQNYNNGLVEVLRALSVETKEPPLDRMELLFLQRVNRDGQLSVWREDKMPSPEQAAEDETIKRLLLLGLIIVRDGKSYGALDFGAWEKIYELSELGKRIISKYVRGGDSVI